MSFHGATLPGNIPSSVQCLGGCLYDLSEGPGGIHPDGLRDTYPGWRSAMGAGRSALVDYLDRHVRPLIEDQVHVDCEYMTLPPSVLRRFRTHAELRQTVAEQKAVIGNWP